MERYTGFLALCLAHSKSSTNMLRLLLLLLVVLVILVKVRSGGACTSSFCPGIFFPGDPGMGAWEMRPVALGRKPDPGHLLD